MATVVTYQLNVQQLDYLLRSPDGPVGQQLAVIAQDITNIAKTVVPVDTGRLRSSITWVIGSTGNGLFARIGTNVNYGPFVELGTSRQRAQPYLVPALRQRLGA